MTQGCQGANWEGAYHSYYLPLSNGQAEGRGLIDWLLVFCLFLCKPATQENAELSIPTPVIRGTLR